MSASEELAELSAAEKEVVAAVIAARPAVIKGGGNIRARLIEILATESEPQWKLSPDGLCIIGATVVGLIDLSTRSIEKPLRLRECVLPNGINLLGSTLQTLELEKSRIDGGISATGVRIERSFSLREAFVRGVVDLLGAAISGPAIFNNCTFQNPTGITVRADDADIWGLFLDKVTSLGEVRLAGARVSRLSCVAAKFRNGTDCAINADRASLGSLELTNSNIEGEIRLRQARIAGSLSLVNATLTGSATVALAADGSQFEGIIATNAKITGTVRLIHAHISGQISFVDATIECETVAALDAEFLKTSTCILNRLSVRGAVNFRNATMQHLLSDNLKISGSDTSGLNAEGITANSCTFQNSIIDGEIILLSARILYGISLFGTRVRNAGKRAIWADYLETEFFNLEKCDVVGQVSIGAANIRTQLVLAGTEIKSSAGVALSCTDSRMGACYLNGARVTGELKLVNSVIEGTLSADGLKLDSQSDLAFEASFLRAARFLMSGAAIRGELNLTSAEIRTRMTLHDCSFEAAGALAIRASDISCSVMMLTDLRMTGPLLMRRANLSGALLASFKLLRGTLDLTRSRATGGVELTIVESSNADSNTKSEIESICLRGIRVGGSLSLSNMSVTSNAADSIDVSDCAISEDFRLRQISSDGGLRLSNSKISGCCDLETVIVGRRAPLLDGIETGPAFVSSWLAISDAEISRLVLPRAQQGCSIDLSRTRVVTLVDFESAWPKAGLDRATFLELTGFEYQHLENPHGLDPNTRAPEPIWRARLKWLFAQPVDQIVSRFNPFAWQQLSKVLTAQGYEEEARRISIEQRTAHSTSTAVRPSKRRLEQLLRIFGDYGFNPWRTVLSLFAVWIVFASIYGAAMSFCSSSTCADGDIFLPVVAGDILVDTSNKNGAPSNLASYPAFEPLSYSLDLLIPILDLGTENLWRPNTSAGVVASVGSVVAFSLGGLLYACAIIEEIIGAFLVAYAVAGFTGLMMRTPK